MDDRQVLTVICPPLFSEFARTYMALRKLAISIAEAGYHVFRFDYRGTGDSFGDLTEVNVSDWIEDIRLAIKEGREVSGCSKVQILAVRAGALLVCASVEVVLEVERLVLWDPIHDGPGYLQALRSYHLQNVENNFKLSRVESREVINDIAGWHISERMHEEFISLNSDLYSLVPKNKLHIVHTALASNFLPQGVIRDIVSYPCNWESDDEDLINPQPVLERLYECLTKS